MEDNHPTTINATPTLALAEASSKNWLETSMANSRNVNWLHDICRDVTTVESAVRSNAITIGRMAREAGENGEKRVKAFIKIELLKFNWRINVKNPLTETDINYIADTLTRGEYRSLNVADINLILENIINGVYGRLYERISTDKVMDAVGQYFETRMTLCRDMNQSRGGITDNNDAQVTSSTETMYRKFIQANKIRREVEQDRMIRKMILAQERQKKINDYKKKLEEQHQKELLEKQTPTQTPDNND